MSYARGKSHRQPVALEDPTESRNAFAPYPNLTANSVKRISLENGFTKDNYRSHMDFMFY